MTEKPDIRELAIAAWRLEKWLENLNSDRKMAAKSALRGIKKYISASDVEIIDPIGSKFDPGLAVEVINNEAVDAKEEDLIIIETISPYVYQNGQLIQHARVIIGTSGKTANADDAINEGTTPLIMDQPESGVEAITLPADGDDPLSGDVPDKHSEEATNEKDEITIGDDEIERIMKYAKIL